MNETDTKDRLPEDNITEVNTGERKSGPPPKPVPGGSPASGKPGSNWRWIAAFFVLTFLVNVLATFFTSSNKVQIEYSQFVKLVESGSVETVQI